MGIFSKKILNSENQNNYNYKHNNSIKWIYTIKYSSIFETFKYPNPMDFFFGLLGINMLISYGFESALGIFFTLFIIDGYFWYASKGNKFVMSEEGFQSNMWTKVRINYSDIISCEIRDTNTLVINSKVIGNFYLHNLHMFEFERIKSIIDEKIKNN